MAIKKVLYYKFIAGFLSVFGLGLFPGLTDSILQKDERKGKGKDFEKLNSDWHNIGKDINKSYGKFKSEHC